MSDHVERAMARVLDRMLKENEPAMRELVGQLWRDGRAACLVTDEGKVFVIAPGVMDEGARP